VALDVDRKTVDYARKTYPSKKILFDLYDGKIPFEESYFDAVVSMQVIEHVKDDMNFVSELSRVVKKDSPVILTTPNANIRRLKNNKPWNEFHCREYFPEEFEKLLINSFSSVDIYGVTSVEKIVQIELNRVKKAAFLASLDPFKLRKYLPDSLKSPAKKIIKRLAGYGKKTFNAKEFSYKDFYVSKNNLNQCLDLLAICRK
jgi:2-polyprenyl-3-methyl-5-hydroxy-6-metoxy-1,4-benzoquinol methylase